MSATQISSPIEFIIDQTGQPKAAILNIALWQEILQFLEQLNHSKFSQRELKKELARINQQIAPMRPTKPDPLLQFIGAVSHGGLAQGIDEALY